MPISPTTFLNSKTLDPARNHRAYADVVVTDATGALKSSVLKCLVDSGSDYTVLPISAAKAAGIVPSGPKVTFRTAGGATYKLASHPNVRLVVEGYQIFVQVAFSTAPGFSPLLGRLEAIEAFDFGFDDTDWYWG